MSRYYPLMPAQMRAFKLCCRVHKDAKLITDMESGDMICPECGLVVGDRLVDPAAEWRSFGDGPDNSRVGNAEDPYFESGGLTTIIGPSTGEDGIKKYAKYSKESAKDVSLRKAFREMADAADRIHLPGMILETARGVYKEVHDRITSRGDHKGALGIACLFIACRIEKVPRTFKEICESSSYQKRRVGQCFKEIVKLLNIGDMPAENVEMEYMERFGDNLCLSRETCQTAALVARRATEGDLFPSRGIDVVCGAALLVTCIARGEPKSLAEMVHVTGASRNGLLQAYRLIATRAKTLFPDDPAFKPAVSWEELPKYISL